MRSAMACFLFFCRMARAVSGTTHTAMTSGQLRPLCQHSPPLHPRRLPPPRPPLRKNQGDRGNYQKSPSMFPSGYPQVIKWYMTMLWHEVMSNSLADLSNCIWSLPMDCLSYVCMQSMVPASRNDECCAVGAVSRRWIRHDGFHFHGEMSEVCRVIAQGLFINQIELGLRHHGYSLYAMHYVI